MTQEQPQPSGRRDPTGSLAREAPPSLRPRPYLYPYRPSTRVGLVANQWRLVSSSCLLRKRLLDSNGLKWDFFFLLSPVELNKRLFFCHRTKRSCARKGRRDSPETNGVAQGRVSVAIFGVDGGPVAQEIVHHVQVALAGRDVQRRSAVVVLQTQVAALGDTHTHTSHCNPC